VPVLQGDVCCRRPAELTRRSLLAALYHSGVRRFGCAAPLSPEASEGWPACPFRLVPVGHSCHRCHNSAGCRGQSSSAALELLLRAEQRQQPRDCCRQPRVRVAYSSQQSRLLSVTQLAWELCRCRRGGPGHFQSHLSGCRISASFAGDRRGSDCVNALSSLCPSLERLSFFTPRFASVLFWQEG
jgi:hypothetical protein